ncbi:hypothetical protein [Nocardia neocaledoniensis]|uniref:hypothetical protein n=1 Tax=Nocardia neocaledoniensis TaxID=236511 RepID=UPI0024584AD1|nr:hypothetical protein [Nocardia neocaledoniensis]
MPENNVNQTLAAQSETGLPCVTVVVTRALTGGEVRVVADAAGVPTELTARDTPTKERSAYGELRELAEAFQAPDLPDLEPGGSPLPTVTLGELVEAGALTVLESPPTLIPTAVGSDMLIAKDIRLGRPASKLCDPQTPGAVTAQPGEVVVAVGAPTVARVCTAGVLVAPGVTVLQTNPNVVDAVFLAGVVRAAGEAAGKAVDLFAVTFPRLPLGGQRDAGAAIARLMDIESAWRAQRLAMERLVGTGLAGLATGILRAPAGAGDSGE